ncbi:hypothetical protein [Novosphingobium huizhouense]|uniref:hypothetical protein n=1 Tax=Novosphingobium huizhouense TaxID=2866625 RepID=UPI001CD88C2F|nr:hypothetical protein [Novosphingobium huizhouense]
MSAIVSGLFGAVGSLVSRVLSPKPKKQAAPIQAIDRSPSAVSDALQSRRGSRVNQRTGGLGAEASPSSGAKSKLGE